MTLPRKAGYRVTLPPKNVQARMLANPHLPTILALLNKIEGTEHKQQRWSGAVKSVVPQELPPSGPSQPEGDDLVTNIAKVHIAKKAALHQDFLLFWNKTVELLMEARPFREVTKEEIQRHWEAHMASYKKLSQQLDETAERAKQAARRTQERRGKLLKGRRLPQDAVARMEGWYLLNATDPYPTQEEKEMLALQCGIHIQQVTTWFMNRRSRDTSS